METYARLTELGQLPAYETPAGPWISRAFLLCITADTQHEPSP